MKTSQPTVQAINSHGPRHPLRPWLLFALFTLMWGVPLWFAVGREVPLFAIAPLLGFGSLGLWESWRGRAEEAAMRKRFEAREEEL